MVTIFLSHSSQNNSEAIALRDWMRSEGWDDIFLDLDPERGIKAGERWQEALKRASANCELVIFLISPAWAASKWCLAEFLLAKQLNKRIFGAIIQSTPLENIPGEMAGEWQIVDLTAGTAKRLFSVQQPTEDQPQDVHFSQDGLDRLKIGLLGAGLDPKFFDWPPESDPDRSPYRGLKAIEEKDAGIFFGREGPIVEGLDHLRGLREAAPPRMFVILGASGAGKSSYMRAGLLPRLRRDSRHFRVLPVIRPNRAVLEGDDGLIGALEQALREVGRPTARSEIRTACHVGAKELATLLAPLVATADDGAPPPALVLPIDQGEELFQADGAEEAQVFLGLLKDLLTLNSPSLIALVTIRSDSYEPLQSARALDGIRQRTYSLPPMPRGSYSEVIQGPVRRRIEAAGPFVIEDTLVEALLADIDESDAKDSLPLLAFTLERLYRDEGGDGDLKLSEYETTGRIRGAIEAAVQQVLSAADSDPDIPRDRRERLALLRRAMIPALAGVDPDTGTPRRRVARLSEIPAEARPLVDLMIDQRLLATDVTQETGETTVEPAHEALLRQWDLLTGWLDEEAEDLGIAEATRRAAKDWQANACEDAWLSHASGRLQQAETVAARADFTNLYGPDERAYLAACRKVEEARRAEAEATQQRELDAQKKIAEEQRKNAAGQKTRQKIFAGAFAVSLVLLGLAGWQWWEAAEQTRVAEKQTELAKKETTRADAKADEAETQRVIADANATEAQSQKLVAEDEARRARQAAMGGLAALSSVETENGNVVKAAKLALAAWPRSIASDDPRLPDVIENLSTLVPKLVAGELHRGQLPPRMRAEFALGGRFYAFSNGQEVTLRDTGSGQEIQRVRINPYGEGFVFSPDGQWFAATTQRRVAVVMDLDAPDRVRKLGSPGGSPRGLDFFADSTMLAVAYDSGVVVIHDLYGSVAPRRFMLERGMWDVVVSPDQNLIATMSPVSIGIFDARSGDGPLNKFPSRTRVSVKWLSENRLLTTSPGFLQVLDLPDDSFQSNSFTATALSNDDSKLALSREEGKIEVVNTKDDWWRNGFPMTSLAGIGNIRNLNFSADDRFLLAGDERNSIWKYDLEKEELVARFDNARAPVAAVAMPGEDALLVGLSNGNVRILSDDEATVRWFDSPFPKDTAVQLSSDGAYIVGWHSDGMIEARRVDEFLSIEILSMRRETEDRVRIFAVSPGATAIAFWREDRVEITPFGGDSPAIWSAKVPTDDFGGSPQMQYSPDGRYLALAEGRRGYSAASVLDTETGEILCSLEGSTSAGEIGISFSPDGYWVKFSGLTGWLEIPEPGKANAKQKDCNEERAAFQQMSGSVTYSLDGTRFATHGPGSVSIWDMATSVRILGIPVRKGSIRELVFTPDGRHIVSHDGVGNTAIIRIPEKLTGNAFEIVCAYLPDHDLQEVVAEYPIEIHNPICGEEYAPPMPEQHTQTNFPFPPR